MLYIQDLAKQNEHSQTLTVSDRLPAYLVAPCSVDVTYKVEQRDNFYLIHLTVTGALTLICQRCLGEFAYPYSNQTVVAVCNNDERAAQLFEQYECIVSSNWQVDLMDLVIDEFHLYVPQFHPDISDCDSEINEILTIKNETY